MKKLGCFTQFLLASIGIAIILSLLAIAITEVVVMHPMRMRTEIQNLSECILENSYGSLCWSGVEPNKTTIYSNASSNKYEHCPKIINCTNMDKINLNSTRVLIEKIVGETNANESRVWEVKIVPEKGIYVTLKKVTIYKEKAEVIFTPDKIIFNGFNSAVVTYEELSNVGIEIPSLDWEEFSIVEFNQK